MIKSTCAYCRDSIRWESSEYVQRWVHDASGVPMCAITVATPAVSAWICFCHQSDDPERVHRAHACEPWATAKPDREA